MEIYAGPGHFEYTSGHLERRSTIDRQLCAAILLTCLPKIALSLRMWMYVRYERAGGRTRSKRQNREMVAIQFIKQGEKFN